MRVGGQHLHTVLAVVATSVLTVLVSWAALAGPEQVFAGHGPTPDAVTTTPSPSPEAEGVPTREREPRVSDDAPLWVAVLLGTLAAAGLLGFLLVLALVLRAAWDARTRRHRDDVTRVDFDVLAARTRVEEALRADAAAQDAALSDGSPRNAIVAAWHRFELQGERAGVPRTPWETSTEFTVRVLALVGADAAAVTRLGELYREARFSRHELGEEHREMALAALQAIRASMGAVR